MMFGSPSCKGWVKVLVQALRDCCYSVDNSKAGLLQRRLQIWRCRGRFRLRLRYFKCMFKGQAIFCSTFPTWRARGNWSLSKLRGAVCEICQSGAWGCTLLETVVVCPFGKKSKLGCSSRLLSLVSRVFPEPALVWSASNL